LQPEEIVGLMSTRLEEVPGFVGAERDRHSAEASGWPRTVILCAVGSTLSQKVWERHVVRRAAGEPDLVYIDLHLVHEVTSPQAFEGLRLAKRGVRRPELVLATMDHNVPTNEEPAEPISARQIAEMARNAAEFGIVCYPMGDANQGIVHVISPQMGLTQPGMTIVCGDSHTATHGALGALAWGIGTSEIEHVLATQTLAQPTPGTMAVTVDGRLPKDCAPKGALWERALDEWRSLPTDAGAAFDREVKIDARELRPYVSWGTNPAQTVTIDERVPDPDALATDARDAARRALRYMALAPG